MMNNLSYSLFPNSRESFLLFQGASLSPHSFNCFTLLQKFNLILYTEDILVYNL